MSFPHDLLRMIYNDPETGRKIRRRIRHSLEPTELNYKGCRMLVHPADNNTEFQIWRLGRTHEERALRDILKRLGTQPFVAYDVGANAGSFAVRLGAQAAAGSEVHAFEPNPEMRARLHHNLNLNGLKNVIVHDCAISDEDGQMELCLPNVNNLGQARLGKPFENGPKIAVDVCKLTRFLPSNEATKVDFLKVDIEGYEDRAILPLIVETPPSRHPRLIFFEHKHNDLWETNITERLLSCDYQLVKEYGRNALFEKTAE